MRRPHLDRGHTPRCRVLLAGIAREVLAELKQRRKVGLELKVGLPAAAVDKQHGEGAKQVVLTVGGKGDQH